MKKAMAKNRTAIVIIMKKSRNIRALASLSTETYK